MFRNMWKLCIILTFASALATDEDVVFGVGTVHSAGNSSTIGLNEANTTIEIFQLNSDIYYRLGTIEDLVVVWSNATFLDSNVTHVATALNALNVAVVVYEQREFLYCRFGHVSITSRNVAWSEKKPCGNGTAATVSFIGRNSQRILLAYEVRTDEYIQNKTLQYRVGHFSHNYQALVFGPVRPLSSGNQVSLSGNTLNYVAVTYLWDGHVCYRMGTLADNVELITWSDVSCDLTGAEASISLTDANIVIQVFRGASNTLYSRTGVATSKFDHIKWSTNKPYDLGTLPRVAANSRYAVQTSVTVNPAGSLQHSVSLIINRARWMELTPGIQDLSLWQLTLPGTHNSGTYTLRDERVSRNCRDAPDFPFAEILVKPFAQTQTHSFLQQLLGGVRYFDLRPYYTPYKETRRSYSEVVRENYTTPADMFFAYHDSIGARVQDILDDVRVFVSNTSSEFLVIEVTHFCSAQLFDDKVHGMLVTLIEDAIGEFLLKDTTFANVWTSTLAQTVANTSRVLLIYANAYAARLGPERGFWNSEVFLTGTYSNTLNLTYMQRDQMQKLISLQGSAGNLFAMSYTLTGLDFVGMRSVAKPASVSLAAYFHNHVKAAYQTNVICVDFYEDTRVTDVAVIENQKRVASLANKKKQVSI